ncbi:MAG: hypothetical protein JSV76_03005 [Candidatus Bathyarchaeota archaeon]|nr:MAG: hypothetical protein JSV76_03005 [Candidatus Bathyarchaeota archaeon]
MFGLNDDEILLKSLIAEKDWYVVTCGRTFTWSKTLFRREFLRKIILTTQRVIFLRANEIDSAIPVDVISRAVYDRARTGDSYLRLELKNGDATSVIFRHEGLQRLMGIFRLAAQNQITQEWILAINDLVKRKEFP